jgi:8-oxo-dGTP pyrophosphatase MutT (NUDIX family)
VLAPFPADPEPTLLFTRRAARVANFPGEVSFPGGRRDPGDETLLMTALRETREEIGVDADEVDVVGRLDDHTVYGDRRIRAYVGFLSPDVDPRPHDAEVERIFTVRLEELARPNVYEGRTMEGEAPDGRRVVHYFRMDDETVWGATGRLVADLLQIVIGWRPPRAPTPVRSWEDFRRGL